MIPPGLLNMNAAKISLKEGYARGIMFSTGVCLVVAVQCYVAVLFARYLSNHPDIVDILQRVAMVIFFLIAIYYLVVAKPKTDIDGEEVTKSKKNRFFMGMFLSSINVFPIPYQAYMSTTMASFGLMDFGQTSIISYVAGAAMGTFVMLYIYIFFFEKIKSQSFTSHKNMNYIIGGITGVIAVITLINIIRESV
ncbi:MAG: LysE family transporter [Flavobacteriaceae bacterium]|nr:LysE family transporter [Bacteroidia bacterium]NNL61489.1 LysE family transporter [Flavobacteriaceae bacterium]